MFRKRSRVSRAEVVEWVEEHPAFKALTPEEKERVLFVVERMAGLLSRQGERAVFLLSRMDDAWISQILSERADELAIKDFKRENLEMSQKVRDRERKSASGLAELSESRPEKRNTRGLASRYRRLMLKAKGAEEEAIAETEAMRDTNPTATDETWTGSDDAHEDH